MDDPTTERLLSALADYQAEADGNGEKLLADLCGEFRGLVECLRRPNPSWADIRVWLGGVIDAAKILRNAVGA